MIVLYGELYFFRKQHNTKSAFRFPFKESEKVSNLFAYMQKHFDKLAICLSIFSVQYGFIENIVTLPKKVCSDKTVAFFNRWKFNKFSSFNAFTLTQLHMLVHRRRKV